MRGYHRPLALVLMLAAVSAGSQPAEEKKLAAPDPCPLATTETARATCWEGLATKADAGLTALYRQLQARIRGRIAEDVSLKEYRERTIEKLKAAQLAWSRYRDAECEAEEQQYEGGTIAPSIKYGCLKELSDRRAEELRRSYTLYFREKP